MSAILRNHFLFFSAMLAFLLPNTPAWPQEIPDSPAGARLVEFLDAINSGDDEIVARVCRESFAKQDDATVQRRMRLTQQLHQRMAPLKVTNISPNERGIVATCETAQGMTIDLIVELSTGEEQLINTVAIATIDSPSVDNSPLGGEERSAAIERLAEELERGYVYPDKGQALAIRIREQHAAGDYDPLDSIRAFAARLTSDLRAICDDKHLAVRPGAPPREPGNAARRGVENYGFSKIEILPGNVGYLKLNAFDPSDEALDVAAAAMKFLENTQALVFDLRDNGGGSPRMIAFLSSYLFDERVHLNSFYERPTDTTSETWTQSDVPGKKFDLQFPIFVLTSSFTFSGAEEFAYNLKHLERATIVGETTGGGAHPVTFVRLGERLTAGIPMARAVNPITKTNWEGVGVKPHVEVAATAALEKAVDLARGQLGPSREQVRVRVPAGQR